jgi:hypothetical protein
MGVHQEATKVSGGCLPVGSKAICRKCNSDRIRVVLFEKEGKKFAVCDACGNIQSFGTNLQDRYSKWKQYRESEGL